MSSSELTQFHLCQGKFDSVDNFTLSSLMGRALEIASSVPDEVPVGAVLAAPDGTIISEAPNLVQTTGNPIAHAEINCLSGSIGLCSRKDFESATLVVTLEPCPLCMAAIREYGVRTLVFGAYNEKQGAASSVLDLARDKKLWGGPIEVISGFEASKSSQLLSEFFTNLRQQS